MVEGRQPAGSYSVFWDAAGFSSGTYYVRLEINGLALNHKMMLVK
tara:strand:+ start:99 stop:233 length:135 start_codon:yes stop_codon:yes gene_type:complete